MGGRWEGRSHVTSEAVVGIESRVTDRWARKAQVRGGARAGAREAVPWEGGTGCFTVTLSAETIDIIQQEERKELVTVKTNHTPPQLSGQPQQNTTTRKARDRGHVHGECVCEWEHVVSVTSNTQIPAAQIRTRTMSITSHR